MAYSDIGDFAPNDVLTAADMDAIRANFKAIGDPWTTYTPTLVQSAAVTKTVTYAKYMQAGKFVWGQVLLNVTGAGTTNNNIVVGLPVTAARAALTVGIIRVYDQSTNIPYVGAAYTLSTTTVVGVRDSATGAGAIGVQPNIALANLDVVELSFHYEAA